LKEALGNVGQEKGEEVSGSNKSGTLNPGDSVKF